MVLPSNGSNTVTITFTDTPIVTASGSIRKVDADDPSRGLAGSVIEITGVDNNFSGTYTTVAGGALTDVPWDAMPIGSYVAEEVTPPSGYTLSSDPDKVKQEFYWDGKTEVALVFENDAKVKVRLLKLDDANDPLPGCVFNILKDGQVIGSDVTNAAGVITVPNVTEGLYAFVEVSSPSPFAKLTEPVLAYVDQATVEGGGTVNVTAANQRLPNLTLLKLDKKDKTPLPDTVFEIRGIHFGFHTDVTTGADGKAVLTGIPVDSYEVTEKSVVDPYAVGDEASQTVYLGPGDDRQLVFENLKKPLLTLSKSEAGVESFNPIPGTVFLVEGVDSDYRDEWTTGADGTVSKYVEPGTYQISEKSVPEPFYISKSDAERVEVISLNPGDEKTVGFQNYRRPLVTVRKENAVTFDPLENAKFQVWWSSNHTDTGEMRDLGTYYTNELGEFTLDVEDGWLKITEVEAPKGFSLPDPATQERFITRGEEQEPFVFQDMPLSAICVWKYDSVKPNVAIENAVFQIRYLSGDTSGTGGTVIGTYKTSANGSFTVTGCKAGTYLIEEQLSSDGDHVIDTPPQTVYLSGKEQEVVKVYFGNSPKGSLLVKKVSSDTSHEPLSDVEFFVTDSSGAVLGNNNGKFVTDSSGSFLIEGLAPNTTVVVRETRAKPGYLLDETPQTAVIRAGQTVSLEFRNQPLGSLRILKFARDAAKTPLANVLFKVTYSDGRVVDTGNGKLSSNGLYYTNSDGEILLTGIVGTVVVTEMASIPGYTMDEDTRTQTVVVNPNDTQTIYFYNKPVGGAEIIKVNENDKKERIPDTVFEIRRAGDDALVDTVTTDKNGRVFVTLEDGSYYAVEIESNKKFRLDSTPHYFEVKDGTCEPVVVTNRKLSGILLHKISSADGEGIPGVAFLLYDSQKNPMDQQTTDDEGYIYFEDISSGRYYLRELENEGYVPDTQLRTVYVTDGSTTEVEWENTPITGQIQLYKYAAEYNEVTGTAPGTPLANAVYEVIWERSGKVVDYLTTDARGVAASKPLPLGRYKLVEVTAPAYWQVDPTVHDVTLEYAGQIIKLSAYDKPSSLGVTITKRGNAEVLAGSSMRYDFTVANTSNVDLESFFWHDRIPTDAARATVLSTGTYSARLNYRILYKTNYNSTYQVLASNLLTSNNYTFGVNAIPVQAGEVVTDIYFDFGKVPVGFQSTSNPTLTVTVSGMAANGYHLVNRADVGGKYQGTWQTAPASWVTIIRKLTPTVVPKLPKTGY